MFTLLGRLTVRRRKLILALTILFVVAAGALGTGVFGIVKGGGFDDPASESSQAEKVLEASGAGDPNIVLLATAASGSVDDEASVRAGQDLTARLAGLEQVTSAQSYWTLGAPPPLRSAGGDRALVVARVDGDDAQIDEAVARIKDELSGDQGALIVEVGGRQAVFADIGTTIESDLGRAEMIAIPITLVLLVLIFGSLVAASLPLLVGVIAILGTFLALSIIGSVTDVSIYSINLTTALGLGLAIDYSLFIVSRFREELRGGLTPHDAVVRTVETAGRTIAFSALTVAVSLSALMVFPLYFLRSFAYAGIAVVVMAMLASVLTLPALLAVIGHRVDSLRLFKRAQPSEGQGVWHSIATAVMRRPLVIALSVTALLLLLGAPFLGVRFGLPDDRSLPTSAESRQVSEVLRSEFDGNTSESFSIVLDEGTASDSPEAAELGAQVEALPGVARVTPAGGRVLTVVPSVPLVSSEGEVLVQEIRALDAPFDFGVEGAAAQLVDTKDAIFSKLPLALGIIALSTFVLLFMMFGSLLVPLKAIVLNLLSLTATFGAMVWIFQDGNGSGLLGFTATGALDVSMPVLMFCIAFGLSMDYEVFLLSRIKEEYDRTGDNATAVALGLERTGRIVTAAAALLAVTFLAFATSGISFMKMFGLGLALAVVMDATIIRMTLVPAFMKLAGDANWWAPAPLKRFQQRFGIHEGETPRPPAMPLAPAESELVG